MILVDIVNVCLPLAVRNAIDAVPTRDFNALWWAAGGLFVLMLLQALLRYAWRIYIIGTSHYVARNVRNDLYDHLQNLPLDYYQKIRTGDLMSRATNDVEAVRMAMGPGVLVAVDAGLTFLCLVPVMLYLSWKLTLLAFLLFPFVPWLTNKLGDKIDTLFESLQKKMSELSAHAQESLSGIRLIKSLVLESRAREQFLKLSGIYRAEGFELSKYQAIFSPTLSFITQSGTFLILLFGGREVLTGAITVGTFIAFQRFVVQLSWPMEAIGWAVSLNREGVAAQRRLDDILKSPRVVSSLRPATPRKKEAPLLELRRLDFQYAASDQQKHPFRLQLENLTIPRGAKIGLVGSIGSGKSTLFDLILRLREPEPDSILFEGVDVTAIPLTELRQSIASVEQQVFLFSESVTTNIQLGLEEFITQPHAIRSTHVTCVNEEISELDSGFDSLLGEKGVNLSGGQRQRLALARALARKPELLLMDDCFSAVDVDIEQRIIANLAKSYPDLSLCFASHRLSMMPSLDEVWVLDHGRLVDRGTHVQLLKDSSLYQGLWEATLKESSPIVETPTVQENA